VGLGQLERWRAGGWGFTVMRVTGTSARRSPCAVSTASTRTASASRAILTGALQKSPVPPGSAPACSSARAPSARLLDAMRCSGVSPYVSTAAGSAPRASRKFTACWLSRDMPQVCNGEAPPVATSFTRSGCASSSRASVVSASAVPATRRQSPLSCVW
jgi:hypothetical protein